MSKENFNPNDVVSRALLLMKYDTKNTLTENVEKVNGLINEQDAEYNWQLPNGKIVKGSDLKPGKIPKGAKKVNSTKLPNMGDNNPAPSPYQSPDPLKMAQQQNAGGGNAAGGKAAADAASDTNVTNTNTVTNNYPPGTTPPGGPTTQAGMDAAAVKGINNWKTFGSFVSSPGGVGIIVALSYWIYTVTRHAGNEEKLRDSVKACNVVIGKGKRAQLQQEGVLKDSQRNTAAKLFYQGIQNKGGIGGYFGQGWGTNTDSIDKATKLIKNGNMADLCIIMARYNTLTDGTDFASDMAGDLDEGDLSEITSTIQDMIDPYAGGGVKIQPEDSLNKAFYKEEFPCVYQTKDTYVMGPKADPDGYTYIVIKGAKRQKSDGSYYNRLYRLYADGARLQLADPTNPKPTNATFACDGATPTAVVSGGGGLEESLYETYLRKTRINEVFDDRAVKVADVDTTQEDLEGWEEGKKVAAWPVWLKKYPCLKLKFPTGKPLTDNMSYTYFINLNPKNNKNYRFYSDGEIWDADGAKFIGKRWSCSLRGDTVLVESRKNIMEQIPFDIEGETDLVPSGSTTTSGNAPNPNSTKMKPCLDFPITQGCYGRVIGEIQSALGINIDAKFGPETLKALKKYGVTDGILTKSIYDEILNKFKQNNNKHQ